MNPVTNIRSVDANRAGAIGKEVAAALKAITRELLSALREARNTEARLGYI